ncbi:hypothetical protein NPIL_494361 [Nephila pilipes]|uniref:Uncharacterized protein n=1 Tax=Nephila pilipes TaxID=299642 RepID=A0A8X6PHN2_NEPPI|nr:hypothetical protein NPIL_494361 [Nephila pilipes]
MQPPASDEGSTKDFSKLACWGRTAAAAESRCVYEKAHSKRLFGSVPFGGGGFAQPTGSHVPPSTCSDYFLSSALDFFATAIIANNSCVGSKCDV